jgi:SAM-dependent methyltransferase
VLYRTSTRIEEPLMTEASQPYEQSAALYARFYRLQGKDYAAESAEVVDQIRQHNPGATSLLDVGCGAGDHLVYLAADFSVTGADLSADMLAVAQQRLPDVTFHEADMRSLAFAGEVDAIVCLFSAVGYMRNVTELESAIGAMAAHLAPGGVLLVDGWVLPDAWGLGTKVRHEFVEDDDGAIARISKSWRDGDTTVLEFHYLGGVGDDVVSFMERHELTLFSDEQYRAAFAQAGLHVDVVPSPMPDRNRYIAVREGSGLGR